ncbi:hypothetical protein RRG08_001658 [Elysia crispata]|uniref:Uncharacterized protein n=1 Tax=Elysia crispata TaxID=231223 RepID=A0AAE1E1C5_9GAST|nr:hypothetical protein RRG08_001658 [Elysia crispata]
MKPVVKLEHFHSYIAQLDLLVTSGQVLGQEGKQLNKRSEIVLDVGSLSQAARHKLGQTAGRALRDLFRICWTRSRLGNKSDRADIYLYDGNDLSRLESNTYGLKTFKDIENLKKIAEQRDQWRILCTRIQKAAEALQSDDYDAERR